MAKKTIQTNESTETPKQEPEGEGPLNYFNYFTEVEDAFIRRRGKHLHLSTLDWELIEMWKDRGVPLHVVLRGIESWFDFYETKRKRRSVNTLMYCQEEIEAQYAEWLESRVGSSTADDEPTRKTTGTDEGLPFPRQTIIDHLGRGRAALVHARDQRQRVSEDDLTDAITRVVALLEDLERDFAAARRPDARQLEVSLTGLERMLSDALLAVVPAEEMSEAQREVKEQLRPYRSHMEQAAYEQTVSNLLLKRLREQFALPRLSLFYL